MRIVAGSLGGRIFASPHGHRTHPMSDKVRGALFNMLGDISGLTVVDPFAGSGALAFEAVSRGARSVIAVENDRGAQRTIDENIELLGVGDRVKLIKANAQGWLNTSGSEHFDLVLLDPPYDRPPYDLVEDLAYAVTYGGRMVLSWHTDLRMPRFDHLTHVKSKEYGNASLHLYERPSAR